MQTSLSGGSAVAGSVTAVAPRERCDRGQGRRRRHSPDPVHCHRPVGRGRRHRIGRRLHVPRARSRGPQGGPRRASASPSRPPCYDRSGKVQLARLGDDRREVVTFADIPPALIDATTSVEDKTFWENSGFDPAGFVAAAIDTINGNDRGGSTITQQLVRARLLPATAFEGSVYERKAKEIIQSIRLTEAYPGETGKQAIIEKYLNQNFYGNRSYGVAAAAQSYWRKDLSELTLAQAALLAGIPQSPTSFDLVKNAVVETSKDSKGEDAGAARRAADSEIVQRRNYILDLMKTARAPLDAAGQLYRRRLRGREGRARGPGLAGRRPVARAAVRVAGARRARARSCAATPPRVREDRHRRLHGHARRSTTACSGSSRSGSTRRRSCPTRGTPPRSSRTAGSRAASGAGSRACRPQHPQRGGRRHGLPDRRGPRLLGFRVATRPRATRSSSPSSTSCPTAVASPAHRSSRSCT